MHEGNQKKRQSRGHRVGSQSPVQIMKRSKERHEQPRGRRLSDPAQPNASQLTASSRDVVLDSASLSSEPPAGAGSVLRGILPALPRGSRLNAVLVDEPVTPAARRM